MQLGNLPYNMALEEDSIETYLLGLDFNQSGIVTLSKTSKKLGIELQITQAVFAQLEQKGIIRKKYALLCPNCNHILETNFEFEVLINSPKYQTCCGDEEFQPTKDDIYVFYEVIQGKKDTAPVQNVENVNISKNVAQGPITNFDRNDTLTEYQKRDLELKERTAFASEKTSERLSEISSDYKEERDIARKERDELINQNKRSSIVRHSTAFLIFLVLIGIRFFEKNLDVTNSLQTIALIISIVTLVIN